MLRFNAGVLIISNALPVFILFCLYELCDIIIIVNCTIASCSGKACLSFEADGLYRYVIEIERVLKVMTSLYFYIPSRLLACLESKRQS